LSNSSKVIRYVTYSTFKFPNTAGTDFNSKTRDLALIAGWDAVIPPIPPEAPILLSPGASITFKLGTSTGATTYWLQINTSSDFNGTDMFNAEVDDITV
jgi:hypothetical protein